MIAHLCRMVWNRRGSTVLIGAEMLVCFLMVAALSTAAVFYARLYQRPLGFEYEQVWRVSLDRSHAWSAADSLAMVHLGRELRSFEQVEGAAGAMVAPFIASTYSTYVGHEGRDVSFLYTMATGELAQVLRLKLVSGRFFEAGDGALSWEPVVLTQKLARDLFGAGDPLGRVLHLSEDRGREQRVVGVVEDYRYKGELTDSFNFMFRRAEWGELSRFVVRVRPGTSIEFEQALRKRIQEVARGWSVEIEPLTEARKQRLRETYAPLVAAGIVAAFLLVLVGLGLTGVLWQSVARRTAEIGLRKALGGPSTKIYLQFTGELLAVATAAVLLGALVLVQVPLASWTVAAIHSSWPPNVVDGPSYAYGLALAALVLYGLVFVCALFPSWTAACLPPARALHRD